MRRAGFAAGWIVALACAAPTPTTTGILARAEPGPVQITEGRPAMGTVLEITLVAPDAERAHGLIERCFAESERLEAIFTTWREDGELARLNARAGRGPQAVSRELLRIVRDAQRLSRETAGTFDVTIGPIVSLWREAERRDRLPSARERRAARARVGAGAVHVDDEGSRIALAQGAALDLGGFAKGWTLDRLGELLGSAGSVRALFNFGGSSLLALGAPLDGAHWRVAVEAGPVLALHDRSVSISSSFGQSLRVEGVDYAHIVDPRSGLPLQREQRAIVIAGDGATAEAWSKAFVVLPLREAAARFARTSDLAVRVSDAGAVVRSPNFANYVAEEAAW